MVKSLFEIAKESLEGKHHNVLVDYWIFIGEKTKPPKKLRFYDPSHQKVYVKSAYS